MIENIEHVLQTLNSRLLVIGDQLSSIIDIYGCNQQHTLIF